MGNSQQRDSQEEEQLAQNQRLKQKTLYKVIKSQQNYLKHKAFCLVITLLLISIIIMNSVLLLLYDDEY